MRESGVKLVAQLPEGLLQQGEADPDAPEREECPRDLSQFPGALAPAGELRDAIERLVLAFPGYGYRRVTKALQRDGWSVNHKRILRGMRRESLLCQLKRRFVATTDARHGCRTYPNLLDGAVLDQLDRVWVAEIVCIQDAAGEPRLRGAVMIARRIGQRAPLGTTTHGMPASAAYTAASAL